GLGLRLMHLFFFQAEDGIRDFHVTRVQTCALPISLIILALLSNSDPRVPPVLQSHRIAPYFSAATFSSEAGAEKPSPAIFKRAEDRKSACRERAWSSRDVSTGR